MNSGSVSTGVGSGGGLTPAAWNKPMRAHLAGDVSAYRSLLAAITPDIRSVVKRALQRGSGTIEPCM
jgi:hypothetical protein